MLPHPLSLLQVLFVASFAFAKSWTGSPFIPPAVLLAVKTPYIQTWVPQGTGSGTLYAGWEAFRDNTVGHSLELPEGVQVADRQVYAHRPLRG